MLVNVVSLMNGSTRSCISHSLMASNLMKTLCISYFLMKTSLFLSTPALCLPNNSEQDYPFSSRLQLSDLQKSTIHNIIKMGTKA
uniref:Uncharacterized protein n=1 Tax=Arundo donax TaxID=35708 RepID=A0A0A9EGT7_ARUDO